MKYTILKQWKTMDGDYYSSTVDKNDYDLAIGEYHAMFKPMQNDTNVKSFTFTLFDENGQRVKQPESWSRAKPIEEVEEVTELYD